MAGSRGGPSTPANGATSNGERRRMSRIRNRRAPGSRCRRRPRSDLRRTVGDVSTNRRRARDLGSARRRMVRRPAGLCRRVHRDLRVSRLDGFPRTRPAEKNQHENRRPARALLVWFAGPTHYAWLMGALRGGRRSGRWPWASTSCGAATPACVSVRRERSDGRFRDVAPRRAVRADILAILGSSRTAQRYAVRQDGRNDRRPSPAEEGPRRTEDSSKPSGIPSSSTTGEATPASSSTEHPEACTDARGSRDGARAPLSPSRRTSRECYVHGAAACRLRLLQSEPRPEPVAGPELLDQTTRGRAQTETAKPERSFEDLLGGRILAWLGGLAIVVGVVFFLVIAVDRGWIGVEARVALAFVGSTILLAAGLFLYERRGQTEAAVAAVASALAALYASLTYATAVQEVIGQEAGLLVAGARGRGRRGDRRSLADRSSSPRSPCWARLRHPSSSAAIRRRLPSRSWSSRSSPTVASPPLAALGLARAGRLPDQRAAARVLGVGSRRPRSCRSSILALYWCLFVVAAIGYELRVPTSALRVSSASVLLAERGARDGARLESRRRPWAVRRERPHGCSGSPLRTSSSAAFGFRQRMSTEIAALLVAVGVGLSGRHARAGARRSCARRRLVGRGRRSSRGCAGRTGEQRALVFSVAFLGLAALHTLIDEAPPDSLVDGVADLRAAVAAVLCVGDRGAAS